MENRKSVLLADASEEFRHLFAGALAEEDDIVLRGTGRRPSVWRGNSSPT